MKPINKMVRFGRFGRLPNLYLEEAKERAAFPSRCAEFLSEVNYVAEKNRELGYSWQPGEYALWWWRACIHRILEVMRKNDKNLR